MNIGVIGTGYVGLVSGLCLSLKHNIICMDINENIINNLKKGIISFHEPDLDKLLINNKNINFTCDLSELIYNTDCCIITIGTPQDDKGVCDISNILNIFNSILNLVNKDYNIIIKSTVPIGLADKLQVIADKESEYNIEIISNPEFLAEGTAVENFLNQDRTIVGARTEYCFDLIKKIYEGINTEFIFMNNSSAELVKLASNSFLALKISFINEIANISSRYNSDISKVSQGIGADNRIGNKFLNAGCGFGGSCFEKDINNLINCSVIKGYNPQILNIINSFNEFQEKIVIQHLLEKYNYNLNNKIIGIWGLSFKPDTSDIRCAPSLVIINELLKHGAIINVHDPCALDNIKDYFNNTDNIYYFTDKYKVLDNISDLLILTEWDEYKTAEINTILKHTENIYDLRGIYNEINDTHYRIGVNL